MWNAIEWILLFGVAWLVLMGFLAVAIVSFCWLFGRNQTPPQVPNKAVWG